MEINGNWNLCSLKGRSESSRASWSYEQTVHWSCAVSREEPARFYGGSDEDDDRVLVVPGAARFLCFFPTVTGRR
jgi:hypothetical protein